MDLMDEELEKPTENQEEDDEDLDNYPEALEVYSLMNFKTRVSRTRRMNWFLDHFDDISELSEPERGLSKPFHIVGLELKSGSKLFKDSKFRISTNTKCLFFSKFYRTSFILDLSPTVFTADDEGSIIYTNILSTVFKLIQEMITPFIFPNSKIIHKTEIFVTLFAFSPFIHFKKMPTLVHGFRVNESTFNEFKEIAEKNFQNFLANFLVFMEPLNLFKDKLIQKQNTILIPQEEDEEEKIMLEKKKKEKNEKDVNDEKTMNGIGKNKEKVVKGKEKKLSAEGNEKEGEKLKKDDKNKKVKDETETKIEEDDEEEDELFNEMFEQVAIDFRLLQMIRMGMLGLYNGPENSQPGLFIVTDGILYIPETQIIQSIATNLRTNCVPLFFIQINAVNHGPSVGLVSSDELLTFLSEISFGKTIKHTEIMNFTRNDKNVSEIQKLTLSWSCQRPAYQMEQALDVIRDNPARIRKQESTIKSNFYSLFHVRIREGYSLVHLDILPKGEKNIIVAKFRLPWTVDCTIDYQISADQVAANEERIHKIRRLVKIETNYVSPHPDDPQDSGVTAGKFLAESEQFALRVINFASHPTSYEVQKQLLNKYPGLYAFTKESYPFPLLLIKSFENSKFNAFWQPFIFSDNSALHRCSHVISSKFVIQYCQNPRPETNYWNIRQPDGVYPMRKIALNAINEYFKHNTSFCLVAQYAYVKIEREGKKLPTHCYIVKIFADSMLLTIKTIFIGDCSLEIRMKTISQIKRDLLNLEKCPNVIHPIGNGVDAKLLKYREKIIDLSILQPINPNSTDEIWESRMNIHRGSLIRFLLPKRVIWKTEKGNGDERCEKVALETMSLLIQRRILEGFKIVFEENGIINMIKEIPSEVTILMPKYEQFIIFPPTNYKIELKGEQVKILREQLNAVGQTLEMPKIDDSDVDFDENYGIPPTTSNNLIGVDEKNDSIDEEQIRSGTEIESPVLQSKENITIDENSKMTLKERRKLKKEKHKKEEKIEEPPVNAPNPELPIEDELYYEVGSYIITEHWKEPVNMLADESGLDDRYLQVDDDKTAMSVLMTFRSMQSELEMAPGIGTALIGKEAYVMHKTEPLPIKLAKDVDYYPFLYNIIKLCFYGERTLVLLPTLKFIHTDPHSTDRLGKILDAFNHEMKNYMPQSFDFEDIDNSWDKLSTGLKKDLTHIDRKELEEAEQGSIFEYETDVEKIMDDEDTPGTGYSSPGATSLPSGTRSLSNQMAGMEMKELTRSILGGFDTRTGSCGSGDKLVPPKQITESRSASALLEADDDDNVEFMPSKKKVTNTMNSSTLNCSNDSDVDSKTKTTKKKKNKNKHGGSTMSLGSGSEKSKRKSKSMASDQTPLSFTVYYKRRDPKTVMIIIIPATCRAVIKITNRLVPKLPVLTFLIEEDRLLNILQNQKKLPTDFRKTNIENFCTRGPLAYLNWQVNAKFSESEREISSPGNPFNYDTIEGGDPNFADLNSFCVNVMHDIIFSRAYAQAAYHCLGTNIHVPRIVLEEVLEERCIQTIVKLGSIKDVLKITCTHLSSLLQSKRVSRYQRHQMPTISSSSSSESEYDVQQMNEYQFMNPFCYSESENDEICRMERKEFRIAFENVLRQHKFFKVPNFNDYYFYWPNGDNTVSLFNSGGVWNERRRNDKNDDQNSLTSSDSSAITVLSENGSENENLYENENDYDIEPLFLQFYINITKDDKIKSYPVDFIPNCLKETLTKYDDEFTNDKNILDDYNLQIEMHVLTISTIESLNFKITDEEIEKDTMDSLETNQKQIIINLQKGIQHMLEMEKILILSRYFDQQRSYKNISRVLKFIENESKKIDDYPKILTATSDMLFVIKPIDGLKLLCKKLENSMVSYCKIRSIQSKIDNSIIFYSCSVEDIDEFCKEHNLESNFVKFDFKPKEQQQLQQQQRQRIQGEIENDDEIIIKADEQEIYSKDDEIILDTDDEIMDINLKLHDIDDNDILTNLDEKVKRKQILHDFWLMAKIEPEPMKIKNYFFQRQNGLHEILFKKFTDKFVDEIKNVNQILLLDDMSKTEECSTYLIQEDKPLKNFSTINDNILNLSDFAKKFFIKPSEVDENSSSDDDLSSDDLDSIKYAYSPGYFFCPLLWYHWFEINPRLRFESKGKFVDRGWRTLQEEMGNFVVKNRKNLYVFKEKDGNVVYIYLFSNPELAIHTINNPKMENEIRQKMKNSILFAVFGIKNPGEAITNELVTRLQRKLDNAVMEELQVAVLKNPDLLLKSTDISFIQPNVSNPIARFYFSLPMIAEDYLASILHYLKQHLTIHYIRPIFLEDKTFIGKCNRFKPYPNDGFDPLPENYDELIFLVNKPKAEGQRTKGIGCFEIRIVDKMGKMIPKLSMKNGKLNNDSFSLLYPGFSGNTIMQKTAKFLELTKSVQLTTLENQSGSINSNYFIEIFVWQSGDIGLDELQTKLRINIQQSLSDLIIEFGVLSQSFLENVSNLTIQTTTNIITRPSSLTRQNTIDQKSTIKKRGSTIITETPTTTTTNILNIQNFLTTGLSSPNNSSIHDFNSSIKSPLPMLQSPTVTKFPFDSSMTSLTEFNVSGHGKVHWKSTDEPSNTIFNTIPIPPLPSSNPEMLRMDFIPVITNFFDFVEREAKPYIDMIHSFQKVKFTLECQHATPTIIRVLYAKFVELFRSCNDSVMVFKPFITKEGNKRLQSVTHADSLSPSAIYADRGHVVELSTENYTDVDTVIVVHNKQQMESSIKQSLKQKDEPITPDLINLESFPHESHLNFGPSTTPFVPRRRFFFIVCKAENISLFLYNIKHETVTRIKDIVDKTVLWNNARNCLLRDIGLHKMQITHLTTLKKSEKYQNYMWKNPEILITNDYPPDDPKITDYTKMPKQFTRKFMKIYRYYDFSFITKNITNEKFTDQSTQFLNMKKDVGQELSDFYLFRNIHKQFLDSVDQIIQLDEEKLKRFIKRCENAHYVETPLLLFPEWRTKIAAIRIGDNDYGSIRKRKQSAPSKSNNPKKHSMEAKMKPRSRTMTDAQPPILSSKSSVEEPCSLKIQYMLAQEYSKYLEKYLGTKMMKIKSSTPDLYTTTYTANITTSPIIWHQMTHSGGILLINLYFDEPYFCIKILFWNRSILTEEQNIMELRNFIKTKNELVSKCHIHSFTYDFHLRMVSTYLIGGTQVLFNPGYNTSAFLIDFLQYYNCRPPSARNCIFEEDCSFDKLKVPGSNIWNNFLKNAEKYLWKVVKLKTFDGEEKNEYMLVSTVNKEIFGQKYEGIRLITNVSQSKGVGLKEPRMVIRYYVMMVSAEIENPMLDTPIQLMDTIDGEFIMKDQGNYDYINESDDENYDFGPEPEINYDSDTRQSSGSNSDRSQLPPGKIASKNRNSELSLTLSSTGNEFSERTSSDNDEITIKDLNSPCPSPLSNTLVESLKISTLLDTNEVTRKLSKPVIQKIPPRGHRKHPSISNDLKYKGAIPPEQVTYVHYYNQLQKNLQKILEEFANTSKEELNELVKKAELQCHVESLWIKLLSTNSISQRKSQMTVFQQIGSKLDLMDANQLLKQVLSTDLSHDEWTIFLKIIKIVDMSSEEPRLELILSNQNYLPIFKFLLVHFEGEKRCRYFDFINTKNLIITNPSCLDCATLFEYKVAENQLKLFMLFKENDFNESKSALFSRNAIHKQFEEIMQCLAAFMWFDLFNKRLTL